jgi:hypothetical protein
MTELVEKILLALNMEGSDLIKPKRAGTKDITCFEFIEALLLTDSVPQASELLGIG